MYICTYVAIQNCYVRITFLLFPCRVSDSSDWSRAGVSSGNITQPHRRERRSKHVSIPQPNPRPSGQTPCRTSCSPTSQTLWRPSASKLRSLASGTEGFGTLELREIGWRSSRQKSMSETPPSVLLPHS